MSKNAIMDYVLNSPQNTNPAILKQLIDENSSSGVTSWNDLIDKPFYHEVKNTVLIDNRTWTTVEGSGQSATGLPTTSFGGSSAEENQVDCAPFELGQLYKVIYNGKEYMVNGVNDGYGSIALGAYSYWELTEDVPFSFSVVDWKTNYVSAYVVGEPGSSHTFTIEKVEEELKTLDPKYLPVLTVNFHETDDGGVTADKTVDEVLDAIANGYHVVGIYYMGSMIMNMQMQYSMNTDEISGVMFTCIAMITEKGIMIYRIAGEQGGWSTMEVSFKST